MQPFTFFISYRRHDAGPLALLLKNEIEKRLAFVRVFVDVEAPVSGEPLPDRVRMMIGQSHATIALIGAQWMPPAGAPVVAVAEDHVALELEYSKNASLGIAESCSSVRQTRLILPLFVDVDDGLARFAMPRELRYLNELDAERITRGDWASAIAALVDRIAVAVGLKVRSDAERYPPRDPDKPRTQPIADADLARTLTHADFEGWYVDHFGATDVRYLAKTFAFATFVQAMAFMDEVGRHCEAVGHHPEWRNVYRHVTVALTTWDARRRVTVQDLDLARFMNVAAKNVAEPN